ncbi:MAG: SDR family oxidoreductase [Nitrospirae bacterium]|nr:SDR family oxidoreductase [Nitrospirota bacterium]MBI5696604.1 SDR family oxidoreductase [Nitrospirota bacterium]
MLKGRVAIVTGGGRGLGRAIAVALAAEGARVAVASRTKSELEKTVSMIADRGGRAIAVRADVSDEGDVRNLVRAVGMKFGPADVLVNNAGVEGPVGPLKDVPEEEFDRCLSINMKGMFLMARAVIPGMIRLKRGRIINVTSGLGGIVLPRLGVYSISKAAINHFTRILARELEEYNIQVNGLDPGTVDTSMQERLRSLDVNVLGVEGYRLFKGLKDGGYLRRPEDAARLAVFLASDMAGDITGEVGSEGHFMKWGFKMAA